MLKIFKEKLNPDKVDFYRIDTFKLTRHEHLYNLYVS
jgi:hypothetical protein